VRFLRFKGAPHDQSDFYRIENEQLLYGLNLKCLFREYNVCPELSLTPARKVKSGTAIAGS
jgi:hypothetical protein